jgi:hypothetical protein
MFFYPGLLLFILGAAGEAWLIPGPRSAGDITFGINTLLFSAASLICGFQAMAFYVLAKTYAIRSGLLPEDALVARLRDLLRLEVGLLAGALAVGAGLALATFAVGVWGARSFGDIELSQSLRTVIPSTTLLILGLQIIFSSCLLSILQLETRTTGARTRKTDFVAHPTTGRSNDG